MARQWKTRRAFLRDAALGGAGLLILSNSRSARAYAANDKLNIALIGVGGRGKWFVDTTPKMENVVAMCDVNESKAQEVRSAVADFVQRYNVSWRLEKLNYRSPKEARQEFKNSCAA